MRDNLIKLLKKGFFHIVGSSILNKVIQFASSLFLVRLLSKDQFGLFSYANNLLVFFLLFNGLGVTAGMLQFGSESREVEKRNSFFNYGIKIGILFNVAISIIIFVFGKIIPLKLDTANTIVTSMFLFPLLIFLFETIQIYFRASLENKKFSILSSFNTLAIFIFSVIGAYYFNIIGIILFRYAAYIITLVVGLALIKRPPYNIINSSKLHKIEKVQFIKFSIISSFNNAISQLLYTIDILLIGLIIVDETIIASYKTATLIPFSLNFIPISIMMFIYPYFARKSSDKKWIKQNYIRLTKCLFVFNFVISFILIIFAPLIIRLLFGTQYLDSLNSFRILSFGYFIASTFRIPAGNIIVMLKKVKFGMYVSIITGILNIILDYTLIKYYGSIGAAIATLYVFIFTSIIVVCYLMSQLNKK